jgi:ankyrin repeat protein
MPPQDCLLDVNSPDDKGETPLSHAVKAGNVELVKVRPPVAYV